MGEGVTVALARSCCTPRLRAIRLFFQASVDRGLEAHPRLRAFQTCASDIHERYTVSIHGVEHREVVLDARVRLRIREAAAEAISVDSALDRERFTSCLGEIGRLEQRVRVVLARCAGDALDADRGSRRRARIGMTRKRHMAEDDANALTPRPAHDRRERRVGAATERALKIREEDDRHRPALHLRGSAHLLTNDARQLAAARDGDDDDDGSDDGSHARHDSATRLLGRPYSCDVAEMGNLRWAALAAVGLTFGIGITTACGGSTGAEVVTGSPDAGSGETGGQGDAGDAPYTLDDVCDRTGPIVCDLRRPCCESGPGFDLTGCLADARRGCEADVAAARAGTVTFHPERIPGCIEKYRALFDASCTLTVDVLQKYYPQVAQCATFEGQLPEGAACERSSQCKPSTKADEVVGCDDQTKKCRTTKLLAEGATCTIGDGLPALCSDGLYCDASFDSQPFTGVCKKKTSLGVACNKEEKPVALECGLGNYCDTTSSVCTAGKPGDATCTSDLECASVSCIKPADAGAGAPGTCKAPQSLVKPEECKGT